MRGRCADGNYARFLEATIELADASASMPRRDRFGTAVAILRVCELERIARAALFDRSPGRLEQAASCVGGTRAMLADVAVDARRRRSLRLVA